MSTRYDLIIIGGGAAGFYAGIHYATARPHASVLILEQGTSFLSKVKVSGGGRCNVTNYTIDPIDLVKNYPRGHKELLGPFYQYGPLDTITFFESHGIELKVEDNGRMFPVSNSSSSIVNLLETLAQELQVELKTSSGVKSISNSSSSWIVSTNHQEYSAAKLLIASGSSKFIWNQLASLGIPIIAPVPSLFTFKVSQHPMGHLSGLSAQVELRIDIAHNSKPINSSGPLLITHQGFSGPAVLECSAWGALALHQLNYQFDLKIDWLPNYSKEELNNTFKELRINSGTKSMGTIDFIDLPKRLWEYFLQSAGIEKQQQWAQLSKVQLSNLIASLKESSLAVDGKSTFKEEFVSAGGVDLKSVNFKTMESRIHPGLYFAGEVLNIDAITGGYNFQNAWTTAYIASSALAENH